MNKINVVIVSALCFLFVNSAFSFDGQREGFVLGIGAGGGLVTPAGSGSTNTQTAPILSGTIAYGFNDNFQLGLGKKVVIFKYSGKTVYQELGGIVFDVFFDDYYVTLGAGISGASNTVSFNNYLFGNASFIGVGYEFTEGVNVEFVLGDAKFDTSSSSVVTPEKETYIGVLLTTFFY